MSAPLQTYLSYKLSGREVTDDEFNTPVCRLCETTGESDAKLRIESGDTVYAATWWKEWSGWELVGIYHATHALSEIVDSDPPRPTAVLRGRIEISEYDTTLQSAADAYTLSNLSLERVRYPGPLDHNSA